MRVSKKEFDNLELIRLKIKETYPSFEGFHGDMYNLEVFGITEQQADIEIKKMNINQLIKNENNKEKNIRKAEFLEFLDDNTIRDKIKTIKNL